MGTQYESALRRHPAHPAHVLGREREWYSLADRLTGDAAGSALVLIGEPGSGATTLLAAVNRYARRHGYAVLAGAAHRGETARPYSGLRQLVPALCPLDGADPATVGRALLDLLGTLTARQPHVLIADCLQWLDQPSRIALGYAAKRLAGPRVVLLGASRPGFQGLDGIPELVLDPLDDIDAQLLVERVGADLPGEVKARIRADARGNPLALLELPLAWRTVASPGADLLYRLPPVTEALRRRAAETVRGLPAETATALLVAALDLADDMATVLEAAGLLLGRDTTAGCLDPAARAGLLAVTDGRISFISTPTRAAVIAAVTPGQVQQAHAALEVATKRYPYRYAWHSAQATDRSNEHVADVLAISADAADRHGEPVEALRRLVLAAQLIQDPVRRASLRIGAAIRAYELGRPDLATYQLGLALSERSHDDVRRWTDAVSARFAVRPPRAPQPVWEWCLAADRMAAAGRPEDALQILLGVAYVLWWCPPDPGTARQVLDCLDRLPHTEGPQAVAIRALFMRPSVAGVPDSWEAGTPLMVAGACPDAWLAGFGALAAGAVPLAADLLGAAANRLRTSQRIGLLTHVQGLHAQAAVQLGDWDSAQVAAAECEDLATRTGQPLWQAHALATGALVAALRGDTARARRQVAEAELIISGRRAAMIADAVRLARGVAHLGEERHQDAYDTLRLLFDRPAAPTSMCSAVAAVGHLAEAAVRAGRGTQALALLHESGVLAHGQAGALEMRYARALLAGDNEAEELYEHARAADLSAWPWLAARIDFAWGAWLRRHRRVAESRSPLQAALHTFELLGAAAWAVRTRGELRAAGVGLPITGVAVSATIANPAVASLSPQELLIVQLAAGGLSNREIGQRLFLSPRTVGSHLYRVFPKLSVTSRGQLAARIGGPAALPADVVTTDRGGSDRSCVGRRHREPVRSLPR